MQIAMSILEKFKHITGYDYPNIVSYLHLKDRTIKVVVKNPSGRVDVYHFTYNTSTDWHLRAVDA